MQSHTHTHKKSHYKPITALGKVSDVTQGNTQSATKKVWRLRTEV